MNAIDVTYRVAMRSAERLKIGNRRNAVDAAARELLSHLLQLSAYTPLDPDEEVLVRMLRSRFHGVDE